jgi:U1 small nuclear ribonucleoprotein
MTDKLPPQLLSLFAPRPPLRYLLPPDFAAEKRKTPHIAGIAKYLADLSRDDPQYTPTDTAEQQKVKRRIAKAERIRKHLRDGIENCISHLETGSL